MTHECLHEVDFALVQSDVASIKDAINRLSKKFDNGVGTRLALHEKVLEYQDTRIKRSEKLQWAILSVLLLGIAAAVIRALIGGV